MSELLDNNATIRNAGDVLRYHTRKVIHRQDVANHSWNVARIYTELFGVPRSEVYVYIIYHDVAEIITGDLPFQVKRKYPALKASLSHVEEHAVNTLGLILPSLTANEYYRVKMCDLIEMREWAETELRFGNDTVLDVISNIRMALETLKEPEL